MRLRAYYIILVAALVLPVAAVCALAVNLLWHVQHDAAIDRVRENVRLVRLVIDGDLYRAQSVMRTMANSQALASQDMARVYREMQAMNAGSGAWMVLYNEQGEQILNTRLPYGSAGSALGVRPQPGEVAQMLAAGKGWITGMRWRAALKNSFVAVEEPIDLGSGRRYVLAQAYSPAWFTSAFTGRALPPGWIAGLADRNGAVIARSESPPRSGARIKPELLRALDDARTDVLRHRNVEGVEVYDVFTHSRLAGWSVTIGAPVDGIDRPVWTSALMILGGMVFAFVLALVLTALFGQRLVRYVGRAALAARRVGRHDDVAALAPSGVREFDMLNSAIMEANARLRGEMRSRLLVEDERNALLAEAQRARGHAEAQNAAKDEFLAMLGHELRNPLGAVSNAVRVLDSERASPAMQLRARQVLLRQSDHLAKLVDDLLDVNRVLMGKFTLAPHRIDLAAVVQRSLETLDGVGRTARFTVQTSVQPAWVEADPTRLAQIVDNVIDNAIKYSPDGGVLALTVRSAGAFAELVVTDAGVGVAPDLLPHVFDMFVQASQPLQRAQGGLGIGLSLVRRLAEMHGGSASLTSGGLGQGSRFTLRLPLAQEGAAAVAPPVLASAALPRRVLLVEDNDDARETMSMLLATCGCTVLAAANGPDGVALAASGQPALGFIDIGLADMDGYAVARALRADPRTRTMRLIALTGYGSTRDRDAALAAGFDLHLTKPISLEQLVAALQTPAATTV
ncbi:ATP-binding protein [Massilia sp. S19_KUP03_FR1]|uniref:ATP-binding protein n=1 Tax=Massilia sp. S19_KUP03_FR1 TaxID=3025503 RepID=UPI002FCDAD38